MEKPHLYKKIEKLARCGGMYLCFQLLRRLRQEDGLSPQGEVAVSRDGTTALQPEDKTEILSQKKKKQTSNQRDRKKLWEMKNMFMALMVVMVSRVYTHLKVMEIYELDMCLFLM